MIQIGYDNFGKNDICNNVSGPDKLHDDIITKKIRSRQDHIAQMKTMSEQLKGTNGKINFKEKNVRNLNTEMRRLREEVEKFVNFFEISWKNNRF